MSSQNKAVLRPSAIDDALQIIPGVNVLSSQTWAWNGIDATHIRHTVCAIDAPPFTNHVIVLYLGRPLRVASKVAGRTSSKRVTKGGVTIIPRASKAIGG